MAEIHLQPERSFLTSACFSRWYTRTCVCGGGCGCVDLHIYMKGWGGNDDLRGYRHVVQIKNTEQNKKEKRNATQATHETTQADQRTNEPTHARNNIDRETNGGRDGRTDLGGDEEEGLGRVEGQGLHLPVRLLEWALRPPLRHLQALSGGRWIVVGEWVGVWWSWLWHPAVGPSERSMGGTGGGPW